MGVEREMVYIPEAEDIYFVKTREYFNEVISNYADGNYRSAVVMLYSVAICDLLFKLQELADMYNDNVAIELLKEVEKCKDPNDNKSKSRWEKELVDSIYAKTELLDLESYTNLNHLYDHRNFSAHPALNDRYELISPSKETTIALIRSILESILIKPPIFIKKVMDMLLEELAEKKLIYQDKPEELHEYLHRKYFDRMSVAMKESTFRSFWKLCFCLPDDEKCKRNRSINRRAMEFLFRDTEGLLDYMKTDAMFDKTSPDDDCVMHLCIFLARFPQIYSVLSNDTKLQITALLEKNNDARIISWFTVDSKAKHMRSMIESSHYGKIGAATIMFVADQYELSGDLSHFIDFCIEYFRNSCLFDIANERYWNAVRPFLTKMSRDQFIKLIAAVNENPQIYNRNASCSTNTEIAVAGAMLLGEDFDYTPYPHFQFDIAKVKAENKKSTIEEKLEEELPFGKHIYFEAMREQ